MSATSSPAAEPRRFADAERAILEASLVHAGATIAVVVDTEGSTYVRRGAIALFGGDPAQVGWLSGGCLEPEIARRAAIAAAQRHIEWMEIDTRDDEALFSGSAVGCRGRLRVALLPLAALEGWHAVVQAWLSRQGPLELAIDAQGQVSAWVGAERLHASVPASTLPWDDGPRLLHVSIAPPPVVAVFGSGPETGLLVPLLRATGWLITTVERRPRWLPSARVADTVIEDTPTRAVAALGARIDAALVMHHHFELDREALDALAAQPVPFIGLLGPRRRRDDLFRVLPAAQVERLAPRLHSPVGLDLGGHGAEAIALSIAAGLQAWRHGR